MPKNTSSSSGVRSSIAKRLRSPIGSMLWRTSVMVDGIGSRARERGYLSRRLLSGLAVALLRGLAGRAERRGEDRPGDALSSRAGDGDEDPGLGAPAVDDGVAQLEHGVLPIVAQRVGFGGLEPVGEVVGVVDDVLCASGHGADLLRGTSLGLAWRERCGALLRRWRWCRQDRKGVV